MSSDSFFVEGAERSETTVFRLMLDSHPDVSVCPEFEYVVDPIVDQDNWPSLEDFHQKLTSDWVFLANDFDIDPSLSYTELAN